MDVYNTLNGKHPPCVVFVECFYNTLNQGLTSNTRVLFMRRSDLWFNNSCTQKSHPVKHPRRRGQ